MPKAYAIVRGNGDILVGSGGNVGHHPAPRTGLHLPGGTQDWGESAVTATLRELGEETGITLLPQDVQHQFTLNLNGVQVTFVVYEVASVADTIAHRVPPPAPNPHDQPFAALQSIPIAGCETDPGFAGAHGTDWFASGLAHAHNNGML